jgi:hypothetical protein
VNDLRVARLLFVILAALLVQSCSPSPLSDESGRIEIVDSKVPISGVDGFEIQYVGLDPKALPFFEVGYAIWANYPYFTYAGDTYERAGVGGVVIRRHVTRPTRYLVVETIKKMDPFLGHPLESTLTIVDKETHAVIAHRTLRQGEIENGMGWVGQHAAEFVRKNLLTDAPIGIGGVGVKIYPRVPVEVTPLPVPSQTHDDSGCGSDVSLPFGLPPPMTLNTPRWRFLPQAPISDFACSHGYILVLSNVFPNDLFLDVLTEDGTYLFQTEILDPPLQNPMGIGMKLDNVSLSNSSADFNVLAVRTTYHNNQSQWRPEKYVHVHMPIASHQEQ